jgi:carbon-monoxide dehydrogenase medium subunit
MPAVLLALDASVEVRSTDGSRSVRLADFLVGPFTTALGGQELVTDIVVSLPAPGSASAYASVEHPASGFALVGAAALVGPAGETVAVTGVAATPFVLDGDPQKAIAAAEIFGDRFASEEYRRELALVVARRALASARERSGG